MISGLAPVHPGEMLKEEFMVPLSLSINGLARDLHVAPNRISHIVNRERSITADTALRLAAFFGTSPEFWMNLQSGYDLEVAQNDKSEEIKKHVFRFKSKALNTGSRKMDVLSR
jgi:addiction module HigA family antidote